MVNALNWFELPALDFERALKFYNSIFEFEMPQLEMGKCKMGFFPCERSSVGGAVVAGEGYKPSKEGALIYLNAQPDLNNVLSKIEPAGGKIITPKTLIKEEHGYFAIFIDSEGNRVALHSMK